MERLASKVVRERDELQAQLTAAQERIAELEKLQADYKRLAEVASKSAVDFKRIVEAGDALAEVVEVLRRRNDLAMSLSADEIYAAERKMYKCAAAYREAVGGNGNG